MAHRENNPTGSGSEEGGPSAYYGNAGNARDKSAKQEFATGANRSGDTHKVDYEGHFSPSALRYFGNYMHRHRVNRRTGETRDSDNWQLGIPLHKYMKSLVRHTLDLHQAWRGTAVTDPDAPNGELMTLGDLLAAIIFNAQGMLHELVEVGATELKAVETHQREDIERGTALPAVFYGGFYGGYPTQGPQVEVSYPDPPLRLPRICPQDGGMCKAQECQSDEGFKLCHELALKTQARRDCEQTKPVPGLPSVESVSASRLRESGFSEGSYRVTIEKES